MLKKYCCALVMFILLNSAVTNGSPKLVDPPDPVQRPFGLGIMLGEPTGLNAKYWLSNSNALQFGLAYSFGNYMSLLGDYLFHFRNAFSHGSSSSVGSQFVPYVGVGGEVFFSTTSNNIAGNHFFQGSTGTNTVALGIRIPLGIEYLSNSIPIGISAEIVPGIGIVPLVFGFVQGDVSVRYYF